MRNSKIDVNKYIGLADVDVSNLKIDGVQIFETKERSLRRDLCIKNFGRWCDEFGGNNSIRYEKNVNHKKYETFDVDEVGETGIMSSLHLYRFIEFLWKCRLKK